ncbi:MAG: alanine racemase [Candidatus Omnitrophica bacterium]|nr:alanine racemase [Candidatus Omnitrophota bacterium]
MKEIASKSLSWAEIDKEAIIANLSEIRRLAGQNTFSLPTRKGKKMPVETLAVIKADAYGHGMIEVAKLLRKKKVGQFAVSDIFEGKKLRKAGIKEPILLLESTLPEHAQAIVDHKLMPTICNAELAEALNSYAAQERKVIDVHVEVDTGMGRLGVSYKDALSFIKSLYSLRNLRVMGIFTHFPSADTDSIFTEMQVEKLYKLVVSLDKKGMVIPYIHAANSMGLCDYKTHVLNLVRPGLMIYGLYPLLNLKKTIKLTPALRVYSRIILIKKVPKNSGISYGRTFIAPRDMTVAVLPLGYNDGYLRSLSNKSFVLVRGKRCPVLGRVTMDQIIIDISHLKNVGLGERATVLGQDGREEITADFLAYTAGTINYEIACSLGNRLSRFYKS